MSGLFVLDASSELFGNLLENACEACEKVKDGVYITLTVHMDNESL